MIYSSWWQGQRVAPALMALIHQALSPAFYEGECIMPRDPEALKAHQKAYNAANRDKMNQRRKAWRKAHPEATRAADRAWKDAHREQVLATKRASEAKRLARLRQDPAFRERERLRSKAYRQAHPDLWYARSRAWLLRDAERRSASDAVSKSRRRARVHAAPRNDLTRAEWEIIKAHYGHRCVYCGRKMQRLTMDHILPLAKGGSHTLSNVVPACRSCNARKNAGPPPVPVQPLLL